MLWGNPFPQTDFGSLPWERTALDVRPVRTAVAAQRLKGTSLFVRLRTRIPIDDGQLVGSVGQGWIQLPILRPTAGSTASFLAKSHRKMFTFQEFWRDQPRTPKVERVGTLNKTSVFATEEQQEPKPPDIKSEFGDQEEEGSHLEQSIHQRTTLKNKM